jgi:hypothetical protein
MSPEASSVLASLLDAALDDDPTTVDRLTNHLPMALVAKERLGASGQELQRFAAAYAPRLVLLPSPGHVLDRATWESAIGRPEAVADLRLYFGRAVTDHGVDQTLRDHLPALLPGLGGAAFHGVIRLSYALEVASPARIAAGLAYLAAVARPLGPLAEVTARVDDPGEVLAELSGSAGWTSPPGSTIGQRMRTVAADDRFVVAASSLALTEETEDRLAAAALRLFASTGDFTALHGVTGLAAISTLRPWLGDPGATDRYTFQALLAAYLSLGAPPLWSDDRCDEFAGSVSATVEEVAAVGATSDDEHVSKLIYTAHLGWERTGDPLYLAAAAREAGLHA